MSTHTKSKQAALPLPSPPDWRAARKAARLFAFTPLLILFLWYALGKVVGPALEPYPALTIPPVPRLFVIAAVAWAIALMGVVTLARRSARATHKRAVEKISLFNALAKAGRFDPHAVRFKATRDDHGRIVSVDMNGIAAILSPNKDVILSRAFAGKQGIDPDLVSTTRTTDGHVRVAVDNGFPDGDPTTAEPAVDELSPIDPLANESESARATRILRGALGDTKGKQFDVRAVRSHKDGRPDRFAIHYPPERTHGLAEALPDVVDSITKALPPRNGVWAHDWTPERDLVVLTDEKDPLDGMVPLHPVEQDVDLVAGVPIGRTEDGDPWLLPLMGGAQLFIAGATGAGKSSVLWSILRALEGRVANGSVKLWVLDPKLVELHVLDGHVHRFATEDEDVNDALREAVSAMQKQKRVMAAKGMKKLVTPTVEVPAHIVIVDEVASMTENPDRNVRDDFIKLTSLLIREGRALGFTLIVAGQDVRKSALPHRALFTLAVCLRVNEAADVAMVLGQGARAQGAYADKIVRGMPGVAYVANEATGDILRVRASYLSEDEQDEVKRRLGEAHAGAGRTAPVVPTPTITEAPKGKPKQTAIDTAPAPAPAAATDDAPETGQWVRIKELPAIIERDGHVYVLFPGDEDTLRVTAAAESDEDGLWEVTYSYFGGKDEGADEDGSTEVQVMPAATWA